MFSTWANVRENASELASVGTMLAAPVLSVIPWSVLGFAASAAFDAALRNAEIWLAMVIAADPCWKISVRTSAAWYASDREDARRSSEVRRVGDVRSRPVVGGHTHVFEDECAKQKIQVAGEWVKCLTRSNHTSADRQRGESVRGN